MARAKIGVIGGSGVYDLPGLADAHWEKVDSPWGEPSDDLLCGRIGETDVVFLARHGRGHRLSPSGINYRANIDCLKRAGVTDLIAVSACGSFRPEFYPGFFVLPDQFVDRTFGRESSFFGNGCVAHVSLAHPVAPLLQGRLADAAQAQSIAFHKGGTYVCMEGPQFSTLAESLGYRAAGYDIIGMTACPEMKLAREAEMSYAMVAMVTDYDCWHPDHDHVEVSAILHIMHANAEKATRLLSHALRNFSGARAPCPIGSDRALDHALVTAPEARDPALLQKLDAILARVNGA